MKELTIGPSGQTPLEHISIKPNDDYDWTKLTLVRCHKFNGLNKRPQSLNHYKCDYTSTVFKALSFSVGLWGQLLPRCLSPFMYGNH